jgi:hypothetical protein
LNIGEGSWGVCKPTDIARYCWKIKKTIQLFPSSSSSMWIDEIWMTLSVTLANQRKYQRIQRKQKIQEILKKLLKSQIQKNLHLIPLLFLKQWSMMI